jgi:hypothetical protein
MRRIMISEFADPQPNAAKQAFLPKPFNFPCYLATVTPRWQSLTDLDQTVFQSAEGSPSASRPDLVSTPDP